MGTITITVDAGSAGSATRTFTYTNTNLNRVATWMKQTRGEGQSWNNQRAFEEWMDYVMERTKHEVIQHEQRSAVVAEFG